jgi:hypothetical protein
MTTMEFKTLEILSAWDLNYKNIQKPELVGHTLNDKFFNYHNLNPDETMKTIEKFVGLCYVEFEPASNCKGFVRLTIEGWRSFLIEKNKPHIGF